MDFLTSVLARMFDNFKASNPKIAMAIIFVLGVFLYAAQNGLPELIGVDLSKVVQWIVFLMAALTGSRTSAILANSKEKK
jgi:threonine/homoserine/homoserine lactone efflux protein